MITSSFFSHLFLEVDEDEESGGEEMMKVVGFQSKQGGWMDGWMDAFVVILMSNLEAS